MRIDCAPAATEVVLLTTPPLPKNVDLHVGRRRAGVEQAEVGPPLAVVEAGGVARHRHPDGVDEEIDRGGLELARHGPGLPFGPNTDQINAAVAVEVRNHV